MARTPQDIIIDRLYKNFEGALEKFINSHEEQDQASRTKAVEELVEPMLEAVKAKLSAQGINPNEEKIKAAREFAKREVRIYQDARTTKTWSKVATHTLCGVLVSVAAGSAAIMAGIVSLPAVAAMTGMAALGCAVYSNLTNHDDPKKAAQRITGIMNGMLGLAFNTKIDTKKRVEVAIQTVEKPGYYLTLKDDLLKLTYATDNIAQFLRKQDADPQISDQLLSDAAYSLVDASLHELTERGLVEPQPEAIKTARRDAKTMLSGASGRRPHTPKTVSIAEAEQAQRDAEMDDDWLDDDDGFLPTTGGAILSTMAAAFVCGTIAAVASSAISHLSDENVTVTGDHVRTARNNVAATTTELMQEMCDNIGKALRFDLNALMKVAKSVETRVQANLLRARFSPGDHNV